MIYFSTENGGYGVFSHPQVSKYEGLFFSREESLLKTLADIRFSEWKELSEELLEGKRKWKDGTEECFAFYNNVFCYEKNSDDEVQIILDIKHSYDDREFGRYYTVQKKDHNTVSVKFQKKNDLRENIGVEFETECFLFVDGDFILEEKWVSKIYPYDADREGSSGERYVFYLLRTRAKKIFLSESIRALEAVTSKKKLSKTTSAHAKNALLSLCSGMHKRPGLLAGHPWFFQYWTRDEAISAKGLWLSGKEDLAKDILLGSIDYIDNNGRIPNRIPESDIGCADGVGWVFFRLKELYEKKALDAKEIKMLKERLSLSLDRIEKNLMNDGLVQNARLETWMDTDYSGDDRSGKRIEIQALTFEMYRFLFLLTGSKTAQLKADDLKRKIRQVFWNGAHLKDGSDDDTVRPNLFLAYYLSPHLLTIKEWESCFDVALEKLWLRWGGLSTLDKIHPLYLEQHTGQNNQSYHRGDSWYFINNIAAICLLRLNKKYVQYAEKIFEASKKDLFELGAKGCCSEVSSAKRQTSEGCFNQAWSNATFLELLEEMKIRGDVVL